MKHHFGMTKFLAVFFISVALAFSATPALACRAPIEEVLYFHTKLPHVPAGMVAARVEITDLKAGLTPVRAHPVSGGDVTFIPSLLVVEGKILSMLRGEHSGTRIRIQPKHNDVLMCVAPPRPGETGIVVGRVVDASQGMLVIDPVQLGPGFVRDPETQHIKPVD